jgi:hypothetical protein
MFQDDTRLQVISHPHIGKTCIAVEDIKINQRFFYWGTHLKNYIENVTDNDYLLTTSDCKYIIDPTPYENMKLQFVNSPGPKEIENIQPTTRVYKHENLVCQEFRATRNIKKGTQITWKYGGFGWFHDRNLKPLNISFENYPAPKK